MSRNRKPTEATVLLLDIGQTSNQHDCDGHNILDKSKQCATRIIQRKIFSDTVDQFSLVLIGSEEKDNELDYPHISVKYKWLVSPNWDMLNVINNLSATNVSSADWLDGLVVAINLIKNETEAKKYKQLKIVMISNFATPLKSKDQVDDIIETVKDLKINLVVIGPESEEDGDDEDTALKSKTQIKGEIIIGRIVDETEGIICGFDEAMSQLEHFKKITGRAQPWHCDLQIGNTISIPISGFKKFAAKSLLSWKKRSVEKTSITQETVFFQGDKQVDKADVINSYLFGQTVVPLSDEDKASMKLTTEKCFELIGFTKKHNVPRHILLGDSAQYIAPRADVKSARVALAALVQALLEFKMVGIVRKVYCKNSAPQIGALIPTCEKESYFFYYVPLPFMEDERMTRLPSLRNVQLSQPQLDAIDKLIDDMDLSQYDEDEDPYRILINPSLEHTYNMIIFKALNPNLMLPTEPSESVKNLMKPKGEILQNASDALEKVKRLFPLEEVDQKNYRKEAADVFERNSTNIMEVENIKSENLDDSIASFVKTTVTEVGTVDPEGNFRKLLELGEPFSKVCEQMQIAIKKLFLSSNNSMGIQKPLGALSLLRQYCVKKNPALYNQFIASLKDDFVRRDQSEFWNSIVQDKLGLISSEENQESTVSAEEGDIFYHIKKNEMESELNYEMEAEDLLDMI